MVEVYWWWPAILVVLAIALGYYVNAYLDRVNSAAMALNARKFLENARREAELIQKEATVKVRDELMRARENVEHEIRTRRMELNSMEERIMEREANLDRRVDVLDQKELSIDEKLRIIEAEKTALKDGHNEIDSLITQQRLKLEQISTLTQGDAKDLLMKELEAELQTEQGALIRRMQDEARERAEQDARKIITLAIEKYSANQVNEITTSTVALPSDEMKGRIIGKEGRNIRSLEAATGVNVLIDDTPEVVVLSGFDPLRREIARIALERLLADGRIHPARIEEVVAEVESETMETVRRAGEEAIFELGLQGIAPEIVKTLGRLKYRHSYGQNILKHSVEMGHIIGTIASELGLDPGIGKRVGLFHDIGKALDHQVEGGHAIIGADLLKKHGESALVCNAVAAHHREVEAESLYAHLVIAADAMTAARPGARSESTEIYLKRLEKLESIANQFRGVHKSYAIQAGREIRVLVEPSAINDHEAMQMARNISKQIEQELTYPGQIRVTVLRETRCVEYAK